MKRSRHSLKAIRFQDELLPDWTQLLDLAARLAYVRESTQQWFARFTARTGVDDARTIAEHCRSLRSGLQARRESVLDELTPGSGDSPAATIYAAWLYALDTMIDRASDAETCAWHVPETDNAPGLTDGDGDITLRRL